MKYFVLELLILTLLGFIWAQPTTVTPDEAVTNSNSTNMTSTTGSGMTGGYSSSTESDGGNNNSTDSNGGNNYSTDSNGGNNYSTDSNDGNNNSTNSNGTQTTKAPPMMTPMTMKNGQNHVFTSVRLLLGCFVLGALWL